MVIYMYEKFYFERKETNNTFMKTNTVQLKIFKIFKEFRATLDFIQYNYRTPHMTMNGPSPAEKAEHKAIRPMEN